ncbi:asparagine synthase (glutamine-hydrolyzing) [Salipaludibacillus aurantiacus]|uniref:asparagine synthase (glutamine-hydrolyzing) n=1 Tax=Salipaludibacillus aurantiacus TaxID=1601833 RepID=A0A1H9PIE7_9BACI|nr:asparagine synthase (glutamine-hydrolyzing) [Salipaludibacillus aurantiacus]SER47333.1 asparagine synthase (glutamine-hydrolysing) [Salipaludibacillus aurantiacus]
MCGITGWVDFKRTLAQEEEKVKRMAGTLSSRGPDTSTTWTMNHVVFGHTRLIVVDPSGGGQPMTRYKDGHLFTVCYNGELYNTEDIRKELLSYGYTFQSYSDTEVLLTAYIHWREKCVEKLNGIFAFAVWDSERNCLYLARDRLGVKPLFYYILDGGLLFGSEIKSLLAHPAVKSEVDDGGWREIFGLSPSRTPGHGVFRNVKELKPAHWLIMNESGITSHRYWQVKSIVHRGTIDETAEQIRLLLKRTVERQMAADVPVCTFLSGGLDSSAITAFAANYSEINNLPKLKTFSIDYEENDLYFKANKFQPNEDAPWIKKVSQAFNTAHYQAIITQTDLFNYLKKAVTARDLPGMADIDSSLLWFCGEVRKKATVALSGECADEIFGGYPWFHDKKFLSGNSFPWMTSINEREQLLRPEWRKKLNLKEYVDLRYEETVRETPLLNGENNTEAARRRMFYLNINWFMSTLLDRKDRMSMAESLEVRVPFADHELIEYVWNIPWKMKMLDGREKGILRKALEGMLPDDVLYRKKSPYPKTHHPVYKKLVSNSMKKIVKEKDSPLFDFFNYESLKDLAETEGHSFQNPYFGQLMTGPQLIAHLLQVDMWMREYNIKKV